MAIERAQLRELLNSLMRTDDDLEAFCIDYFPQIQKRFGSGMNHIQKLNTLLINAEVSKIIIALKKRFPEIPEINEAEPRNHGDEFDSKEKEAHLNRATMDSLTRQLEIHQKNLMRLNERKAMYAIDTPLSVENQIEEIQSRIAKTQNRVSYLRSKTRRS
jgi:hypothetical protein